MKEIEILVELYSDFEMAKAVLEQYAFKGAKKTVDYYYDPLRPDLKLNDAGKQLACCRLRNKAGQYFVTYKVDHYDDETWIYSDEHETEIQDITTMQQIFSLLGLCPLVTIDNTKYIFETEQYEVVLEDVKNLGRFMEVEFSGADETKSVTEIKHDIHMFIQRLGFDIGPN